MPIFEYVCKQCDHRFELLVHGSTKPECPSCKSRNLAKQLSVFAVSSNSSRPGRKSLPEKCQSCSHAGGCHH